MTAARTVLALVDGTHAAANAAWRAGLVARELGAPLRLLQSRAPASSRVQRAEDGARRLAAEIGERLALAVEHASVDGDPLPAVAAAARDAQLVVLGPRRANPLRELVLGTQAERLIRLCRIPVLVVKRPATGGYRRVLVPVALDEAAADVVASAARLSRASGMEVLHAIDARHGPGLRAADIPEALRRHLRDRSLFEAHVALDALLDRAGAARAARPVVILGDAAATVLAREQAARAELVVIGKRSRGLLADFFLGGVTQRVLAQARCDVLVLPRPARGAERETRDARVGLPGPEAT